MDDLSHLPELRSFDDIAIQRIASMHPSLASKLAIYHILGLAISYRRVSYHSKSWVVLSVIEINQLQFCEMKL